jgi:predicted HD phosphohydrolase
MWHRDHVRSAAFSTVDELLDALERTGGEPGDEVIGALPHLLQTADRLAEAHGHDPELVAAGLVHDLASSLQPGCADHGRAGAALVAPLLGDRVARLVSGHTDAKRYLVTVEPTYAAGLSPNSTFTLVGQGGTMTPAEVEEFRRSPHVDALIALRRADDAAKVPGLPVAPLVSWRPLLERVAAGAR